MPVLMHVVVVFVAVLLIHDSNRAWGFSAPSLTPKCMMLMQNGTKTPLPEAAKLKLDKNYTVSVRYSDFIKNTTALVHEADYNGVAGIEKQENPSGTARWILNATRTTFFNGYDGLGSPVQPFSISPDLSQALFNISTHSVSAIFDAIAEHGVQPSFDVAALLPDSVDAISPINGIEAVRWTACHNVSTTEMVEVEVAYAGASDSVKPFSRRANPLPMRLTVMRYKYNATNLMNLTDNFSFDFILVDYADQSTAVKQRFLTMPAGVFCANMTTQAPPSTLPTVFEASLQYTDVMGKRLNPIQVEYDGSNETRIVSFELNARESGDAAIVGNVTYPTGVIRVVHDFSYGLQYIVDARTGVCMAGPVAIANNSGDVVMDKDLMNLKNPDQLFGTVGLTFYNSGQRATEAGDVDVFTTQSTSGNSSTVFELLYTTGEWMLDGRKAPALHSIIQYHKNESGAVTGQSIQRFSSLSPRSSPLKWSSVMSCMGSNPNGSMVVKMKKETVAHLEKLGMEQVKRALIHTIATNAGVSVLRVGKLFMREVEDGVDVLFVIAENATAGVVPAKTVMQRNETTVAQATAALNKTLEKDLSFIVTDSNSTNVTMTIAAQSLKTLAESWSPPLPPTPAPYQGYTGGSMFVLGLFMFIFGGAAGVGIVYLMWRRRHLGGLAYQVFE